MAGGGGEDGGAGSRERTEETAGERPQLLPPTEGATARTKAAGDGWPNECEQTRTPADTEAYHEHRAPSD